MRKLKLFVFAALLCSCAHHGGGSVSLTTPHGWKVEYHPEKINDDIESKQVLEPVIVHRQRWFTRVLGKLWK